MKIGQFEIDLEEFQHFIVKAKKKGYAGGGKKQRASDGSKIFVFQEGNFHYTDNYDGSYQAPGDEITRWQREDGQRIWRMAYSGGMLPKFWGDEKLAEETYKFLKKMLMMVSFEYPFRGPPGYNTKDFSYLMNFKGDIKRFAGKELIRSKRLEEMVFSQDFIGGLVIPK